VMHELTGAAEFAAAASRWRSYDTRLATTGAVAAKIPFAATKRLRVRARRAV
jgi:hypothetical protein